MPSYDGRQLSSTLRFLSIECGLNSSRVLEVQKFNVRQSRKFSAIPGQNVATPRVRMSQGDYYALAAHSNCCVCKTKEALNSRGTEGLRGRCSAVAYIRPEDSMPIGTIILIILVALLIGALPTWPYSAGWGPYPAGGLGLVLVVLLILVLLGRV